MAVRVTVGRKRTLRERRRAARRSLAASGVLPTYDLLFGSQCGLLFEEQVRESGYREMDSAWWPTEEHALHPDGAVFREGSHGAVYRLRDGTLAHAHIDRDSISVTVAAPTRAAAAGAIKAFQGFYPASFVNTEGDSRIPVTFWSYGPHGPVARLRRIEASPWEPIVGNYTAEVRAQLATLMAWEQPTSEGQLILWQGPPGTGKTWALRALASEWSRWAEFHYITDPDAFFVDSAAYMVDVLLADSYSAIDSQGDVYEEQAEGKWRVLILEDTGELLSAHAKEKYGQGLSRLLNVVDGMIGQGLRVLCLVTTNDELGELNPAVLRPGRCASQIVFGPLSAEEARDWTGDPDAEAGTVAELYGRYGKVEPRDPAFTEEPEDGRDLMAAAKDEDVRSAIARVAEEVNPLAVDNGQAAYNAGTGTVLWVASDSTSEDEVEQARAAFLEIDGVDDFDHEHEACPTGWCDAEIVYGGDPFRCGEEAALADVVALAASPLDLEPDLEPVAASAQPAGLGGAALEAALDAVASAHDRTLGVIGAVVASAAPGSADGEEFAHRALDVLERFAARPADPAPNVSVTVPERETHVHVPAQEAAVVHVDMPEQAPPTVEVTLPAQEPPVVHVAAPAPADVHVDVHVPEQAPPSVVVTAPAREAPSAVVVDFDEHGRKVYTPVHDDPEAAE